MPQWVRLFNRVTSASAEWHVPLTKSFTTTTRCGTELAGPLEVASDDKAEREGRCARCATSLTPPQAPGVVGKKAVAKKAATHKPVRKPTKKRSTKVPVARRSIRRARRGKA